MTRNNNTVVFRKLSLLAGASILAGTWATYFILTGCQRGDNIDGTNLLLQPGVGIKGAIELGFSIQDVRKQFRKIDVVSDTSGHVRNVIIPAIGCSGYVYEEDHQFASLYFDLMPMPYGKEEWTRPFVGKLVNGISFSTGNVFRSQIETAFGKPMHVIEYKGDGRKEITSAYKQFEQIIRTGEPVEYYTSKGISQIHYQTSGIAFNVNTGCIFSIMIYPAYKK